MRVVLLVDSVGVADIIITAGSASRCFSSSHALALSSDSARCNRKVSSCQSSIAASLSMHRVIT